MQLNAGQIVKLKVQSVESDHYVMVSSKRETENLLKRYTQQPLVKNQFISLHVLLEKDGKLHLSTQMPKLNIGDIGLLKIEGESKAGYFLNNGTERDLLLHKDDVFGEVKEGQFILVKVLEGTDNMLKVTMDFPRRDVIKEDEYHVGDRVKGRVVSKLKTREGDFKGIQVLLNNELFLFIHDSEIDERVLVNEVVEARIIYIRDDFRINGTLKPHVKDRIEVDKKRILDKVFENGGLIPVDKKSSSESIETFFTMSKKAFKRALSELLASGELIQEPNKIVLKK